MHDVGSAVLHSCFQHSRKSVHGTFAGQRPKRTSARPFRFASEVQEVNSEASFTSVSETMFAQASAKNTAEGI